MILRYRFRRWIGGCVLDHLGHPIAQTHCGLWFVEGHEGMERDRNKKRGFKVLEAASALGIGPACTFLGLVQKNNGNYEKAIDLFQVAVNDERTKLLRDGTPFETLGLLIMQGYAHWLPRAHTFNYGFRLGERARIVENNGYNHWNQWMLLNELLNHNGGQATAASAEFLRVENFNDRMRAAKGWVAAQPKAPIIPAIGWFAIALAKFGIVFPNTKISATVAVRSFDEFERLVISLRLGEPPLFDEFEIEGTRKDFLHALAWVRELFRV